MSASTAARDRACNIAKSDTSAALEIAAAIPDPWYAAQALAYAGRFAPESDARDIIAKSLTKSRECVDPYKAVGSSAWALRAAIDRELSAVAEQHVARLLKQATSITPAASRSEALFLLFQAVLPGQPSLRRQVLQELVRASDPVGHWRQRRNLRDALLMMAKVEPGRAQKLLKTIKDERARQQVERALESGEQLDKPRSFFD